MPATAPRIQARPPHALRVAIVALGVLAGISVGLSDAPAWIALAIPLLAWTDWPKAVETIPWSGGIVRRGPIVVVSRRYVFLANARERRELALKATRDV